MKKSILNQDEKEEKLTNQEGDLEKSQEEKANEIKKNIIKEQNEEIGDSKKNKEFKKSKDKPKRLKKEIKKMGSKNKKSKYILIGSIMAIFIIFAIIISTVFALVNINNEKMMSGISISEIEVSGLSKEEAKAKIESVYNEKKQKEIGIKYQDYEATLNPTIMEVKYNIDKAIEEAYEVGRKDNIFLSNYDILLSLIKKKNINVEMTLNEESTQQAINDINVNLPGVIMEPTYSIEEDELIITKGKAGILIEENKMLKLLKDNLNDINSNEDYIEIPTVNKEPEKIDIDKIHQEVYKEAKDAYYTKEPFTVYPEVKGIDFDLEAARDLLTEDKEEYVIKLTITKPKITIDQIGSEAFPDRLGTFTTRFDESDVNRSTNLRIACQKINGKVLLAGEIFSYNKELGARTVAAGYRNGKIYSGGEVVDGIGGGICQISSTLYNAVLLSNLEIVERRNHQFVTSYVSAGRDATVVYGAIDFRFKNTRKYPVRIVASAKNGIATVSIFGIKEENNNYTFKFSTKTVGTIPFSIKYVEDGNLLVGTEKVKQKGANGITTETYITKMLNGKVVSTELLSRDIYNAMTKIILKGTKARANEDSTMRETITEEIPTTPEEPQTPSVEAPKKESDDINIIKPETTDKQTETPSEPDI